MARQTTSPKITLVAADAIKMSATVESNKVCVSMDEDSVPTYL